MPIKIQSDLPVKEILEKEKISIIALGPMTNLAKVFSKKPHLIRNVLLHFG